MRRAVLTEVVGDKGRVLGDLLILLGLAVQQAEGVLFQSLAAGGAELLPVGGEIGLQSLAVFLSALGAADGVQVEHHVFQPQPFDYIVSQRDDIGIRRRRSRAQHLAAELVELSEPALLSLFMAEAGEGIEHLLGKTLVEYAVFQHGADSTRRTLRSEGIGLLTRRGNGIHLLLHHIGGIPHRAHEEAGLLKRGYPYLLEAELLSGIPHHSFDGMPFIHLIRDCILSTVGSFYEQSHFSSSFLFDRPPAADGRGPITELTVDS